MQRATTVRFGDFTLDRDRRDLARAGEPVRLARKAFDLLDLLIAERPRAVPKEEIRDRIWPRTFVSESTVNGLLAEVRAALGDDAREPRYIRTIHGFGYAFLAEAGEDPAPRTTPPAPPPATRVLTARVLWDDRVIPLSGGENVLGRDDDVNVRIDARSVSRRHATITVAAGMPATVVDLGSKNGTWIGDRRVTNEPVPLPDGSVFRIGTVELVFLDSKDKGSTETAAR